MPSDFDIATAVSALDIDRAADQARQSFAADVAAGWDIGGNANGGYLLAMVVRAMVDAVGRPPLSVTAHYLAPVGPGPVVIDVVAIRVGRRMATVSAEMHRDGQPLLAVLGTFGVPAVGDIEMIDGAPPDLPDFEDCVAEPDQVVDLVPEFARRVDVRLRPGDHGFRTGSPSGRAEFAGWFAFMDRAPVDEIGLMLVADAFAPPIFNSGLAIGWVPTLELTVHLRARPAPGPLRCVFRSRFGHGGLIDEDGEIWDSDGVLVAQSRQLALLPRVM